MRQRSRVSLGPGAASLILIVVILSMSVLGILALLNARSDSKLSRRSIEVAEAGYALGCTAEQSMADLDALAARCAEGAADDAGYLEAVEAALPQAMTLEGRTVAWEESDGLRTLECEAELAPMGEAPRLSWKAHRLTAVTEGTWN